MANYRFDKRVEGYIVTERTSGLTMAKGLTHFEAQTLTKRLNKGGCFDGNTPAFFLEKIPTTSVGDEI